MSNIFLKHKDDIFGTDEYGFGKLDAWLIDTYLRHKDETLDEEKARIAAEYNRKKPKIQKKLQKIPKHKQNFNISMV